MAYFTFTCVNPVFEYQALACVANCAVDEPEPVPPAEPGGPSIVDIRNRVYAEVQPVPPPHVVQPDEPVVGVPTFLQVEGFQVREASDTAGPLTIGVTATPTQVRWAFSDLEWTCSSGGVGYTEDRLDHAFDEAGMVDDGELCTFLFEDSSAKAIGGPYASSVVTVWDYSWSLNGVDQGVFNAGVVSPPSTFDLTVIEIQAVVTSG